MEGIIDWIMSFRKWEMLQMMSIEYTVPSIILGLPLILLPIDLKFIYSKLAFWYFHAKLQQKDCSHKNNPSFFYSFNSRHMYSSNTTIKQQTEVWWYDSRRTSERGRNIPFFCCSAAPYNCQRGSWRQLDGNPIMTGSIDLLRSNSNFRSPTKVLFASMAFSQ